MSSNLAKLQTQLQQFMMTGVSEINESVIETEELSIATRLGIYRDGYQSRLIESLEANFPALAAYLGAGEFRILCLHYIESYPSTYRSIRWYGHAMAAYLKTYYEDSYSYLAELADFEWRLSLAFDAADDPLLQVDDLAKIPPKDWADMHCVAHSSMQRLNYFWNVVPLWRAIVAEKELPRIDNSPTKTPWVLWRAPHYVMQFYSLSTEEAWLLDGIIQGLPFGSLCEGLCQWVSVEEVGLKAASYLKNWVQQGILSGVTFLDGVGKPCHLEKESSRFATHMNPSQYVKQNEPSIGNNNI